MALCTTQKKQSWTGSQIKSGELPRTGTWVPVVSYLEPSVWLSKYAHCVSQLELASLLLVAKSILTETQHSGEGIVIPVLQLKAQWVKCSQGVGWVRDHTLRAWAPCGPLGVGRAWTYLKNGQASVTFGDQTSRQIEKWNPWLSLGDLFLCDWKTAWKKFPNLPSNGSSVSVKPMSPTVMALKTPFYKSAYPGMFKKVWNLHFQSHLTQFRSFIYQLCDSGHLSLSISNIKTYYYRLSIGWKTYIPYHSVHLSPTSSTSRLTSFYCILS